MEMNTENKVLREEREMWGWNAVPPYYRGNNQSEEEFHYWRGGSSDSDPFFPEQYLFSANKSSGEIKKSHSTAILNQMGQCLITR